MAKARSSRTRRSTLHVIPQAQVRLHRDVAAAAELGALRVGDVVDHDALSVLCEETGGCGAQACTTGCDNDLQPRELGRRPSLR
ncbi:hypothetical protein LT330_010557 [Penicillium expansum]|nr:hypothetical protein LT330_010557 [Penicillium expansum]